MLYVIVGYELNAYFIFKSFKLLNGLYDLTTFDIWSRSCVDASFRLLFTRLRVPKYHVCILHTALGITSFIIFGEITSKGGKKCGKMCYLIHSDYLQRHL